MKILPSLDSQMLGLQACVTTTNLLHTNGVSNSDPTRVSFADDHDLHMTAVMSKVELDIFASPHRFPKEHSSSNSPS